MTTYLINENELIETVLNRIDATSSDWIKSIRRDGASLRIRVRGDFTDVPVDARRTITVPANDLLKALQLLLGSHRWSDDVSRNVSSDLTALTPFGANLVLVQAIFGLLTEDQWSSEDIPMIELQLVSEAQ
jgi:hypothetical protein